jgi:hypothetical protein
MSLELEYRREYRRLAAACLDLAKRAALLADKTRLLFIAEAWLDLADRVTKARPDLTAPACGRDFTRRRYDMSGAKTEGILRRR